MRRLSLLAVILCACSSSRTGEKPVEHHPAPVHEQPLVPVMGGTSHHPHAHLSPHEPGDHHHHPHPHPHLAGPNGHHHPY